MKSQLVGFREGSFTNKDTGLVTNSVSLYFVREPNLREVGTNGNVCYSCSVYGDAVLSLPLLEVNALYDCDVNFSKGRYYLNDIKKLEKGS